jgi:lipopolysaccharide transport system ATP-binding protein
VVVRMIPNVDHRHGDGRAEILGIAILNEYDEAVHLMVPRSRIIVRVSLRANQDLASPAAGFLLRNHLGIDFTETSTAREGHNLAPMRQGEICTVDFTVDIPEFYPGIFSFSPFISDGGEAYCDWIDNAITVQMARGEGPAYGYIQLPCKVELNTPQLNANPKESGIA